MIIQTMDIDEAIKLVGEYGRVQKAVFWSMAIPQLFLAWNHLLNVFVGAIPEFVCIIDDSTSVKGCSPDPLKSPCKMYSYRASDFTSISSEWDLVCDSAYKADLAQSVYMVGLLMGNFIGGYLADNNGRKPICTVGSFGMFFFGVLAITANSFNQYIFIRFLAALCSGAYGLVSFTLPAEMVGSSYRGYINVVTSITFALGISTLPIPAYYLRDWRMLSIVSSLPGLIGVAYFFFLPESPRWLVSQGRIEEAEKTLMKIWAQNSSSCLSGGSVFSNSPNQPSHHHGDAMPANGFVIHDSHSPVTEESSELLDVEGGGTDCRAKSSNPHVVGSISLKAVHKKSPRSGVMNIVRNSKLFTMTVVNIFTWFVSNMTYYGLSFKMGDLNGNKYLNVSLSGIVEIPACLLTLYFMDKHGRKITFTGTLLFSAMVCLLITVMPVVASIFSTFLALLGKTAISMTVCVCWMHAAEMYPTNIRNKAMSLCSMSGRFGGVMAPMVLALGRIHDGIDFLLFGLLASLATVASTWLPETLNRSLPETMEDIESEFQPIGEAALVDQIVI